MSYTTHDLIVATATSPLFAELAAPLPAQNGWGRPRHHDSDLTALVYGACRRLFRSYTRLDRELAQQWPSLRAACLTEGIDLGEQPMTYHRWEGARDRALDHLDEVRTAFTAGSLDLAKAQGKLDPSAGSISRPHRTQLVYGDGTHLRGKFRAHHGEWEDPVLGTCTAEFDLSRSTKTPTRLLVKEGGRWVAYHPESHKRLGLARIDEDAHVVDKYKSFVERGSDRATRARGHGLVMWHVRGDQPHSRITLAIGLQQGGREAEAALRELLELKELAGDGLRGFAYDMAMRGTHLEPAMRAGLLPFVKVVAASDDGETRSPFEDPIGTIGHKSGAHDGCRHQLLAVDGAVREAVLDGQGELVLANDGAALEVSQVKRTVSTSGQHTFSVGVRVACRREPFVHWLTLPAAQQGRRHTLKINLDKLRPYHADHPVFRDLYPVRNDAEAANAEYKKHLLDTRASQVGADRNLLDAILFFAGQNALNARRLATAANVAA